MKEKLRPPIFLHREQRRRAKCCASIDIDFDLTNCLHGFARTYRARYESRFVPPSMASTHVNIYLSTRWKICRHHLAFPLSFNLNVSFGISYEKTTDECFAKNIFRTRGTINLEFAIRVWLYRCGV